MAYSNSVWQYGCALESESPHFTGPGDFFMYIMFVGVCILVSNTVSMYYWLVITEVK